jgi:ATP-dependent Lhr-like helicase
VAFVPFGLDRSHHQPPAFPVHVTPPYWFTEEGEKELGGLNFLDLLSIFTSEDLFEVRCGNKEIGKVDRSSFTLKKEQGVLLLAGRPWTVMEINWKRRVVQVEPSRERGKSRWLGDGPAMPYELCQAIRRVVCRRDDAGTRLTARAIDALSDVLSTALDRPLEQSQPLQV